MERTYNMKDFSQALRDSILAGMTNRQAVENARNKFNVPAEDPAGWENVLRIRKELRRDGLLCKDRDNTRHIRTSALGYKRAELNFLTKFLSRFAGKNHHDLLKITEADLKTI